MVKWVRTAPRMRLKGGMGWEAWKANWAGSCRSGGVFMIDNYIFHASSVRRGVGHLRSYRKSTDLLGKQRGAKEVDKLEE